MRQIFKTRAIIITVGILLICAIFALIKFTGSNVIDPNKDNLLEGAAGKNYAALYMISDVYEAVGQNDDVFHQVEKDMLTFARVTRPEFANPESLVGFTFDKAFTKEGDATIYTGHYYSVPDKIEVRLTSHGRGVYTLSITNTVDQTNIDDSLQMNGKRNELIASLPIEKGDYSIRYQLTDDRIVVTFYDGYTSEDVDAATKVIRDNLGDETVGDVVYSINRIGIVSIGTVRDNLKNPLPKP